MKKALEILRTVYSENVRLIFKSVDISTDENFTTECVSQVQCETKVLDGSHSNCIEILRKISKRCDLRFSNAFVEDNKLCIMLITFDKVAYYAEFGEYGETLIEL